MKDVNTSIPIILNHGKQPANQHPGSKQSTNPFQGCKPGWPISEGIERLPFHVPAASGSVTAASHLQPSVSCCRRPLPRRQSPSDTSRPLQLAPAREGRWQRLTAIGGRASRFRPGPGRGTAGRSTPSRRRLKRGVCAMGVLRAQEDAADRAAGVGRLEKGSSSPLALDGARRLIGKCLE